MIERIIFLWENTFGMRDYQRFGIELLQANGFRVEVWDVTPVLHGEFFRSYTPPDLFRYDGLTLFNDRSEMYNKLSNLSRRDFVINMVSYGFLSLGLNRALSRSSADYAVSFANAIPPPCVPVNEKGLLGFLKDRLREIAGFRRPAAWKNLFMKLPFKWLGVKSASLILAGGDKYLNGCYLLDKNSEVLWIHTLDYDLYLKERDVPISQKSTAVFLDSFLPFHPEFIMFSEKFALSADKYYQLLNDFFDHVEENTGLEVVIAAHPRSYYEKLPDYFMGRKCIKGRTISLVRESQLVLTHDSTAINFANFFYKPLIFITSFDLDKTYDGYWTRALAGWFGKTPVFMDNSEAIDFKEESRVSKRHYDDYRRAYIKTDHSEDLPFWQIVANRLKKLNN